MAGVEPIKFIDLSHVRKREIVAPYKGGAHKPHTAFHHFWRVRKCEKLTNLTNLTDKTAQIAFKLFSKCQKWRFSALFEREACEKMKSHRAVSESTKIRSNPYLHGGSNGAK